MEPFNWIITQKKGEYYYVPTNLYDFFSSGKRSTKHRPTREDIIHYISGAEIQHLFFFTHKGSGPLSNSNLRISAILFFVKGILL